MLLGACNVKQELLSPEQPGVISPGSVSSPAAADAAYVGVLGQLKTAMNGGGGNIEGLWNEEGLFTDEFMSADTFSQRNDADQRNLQTFDADLQSIYNKTQQTRGFARNAINLLAKFDTSATGKVFRAEMYFVMGYVETQMAQVFCNSIPFGETVGNNPINVAGISRTAADSLGISRLDTALAILKTATGADSGAIAQVRFVTLVTEGRALVDLGRYQAASDTVKPVPTGFNYNLDYSITTQDNQWWTFGTSVKRYTAGDSLTTGGTLISNAIPFAELNDPRVPVTKTKSKSEDNKTTFVSVNIWGQDDPIALASGVDARLIQAENDLQTSDALALADLNALRASAQTIGIFPTPVMTPLAPAANHAAMVQLFFREKAFWQFGRGYRMNDLRRLVRQYGLTQDKVFPGAPADLFFRNTTQAGTYGNQVDFWVTDNEKTANNKYTGVGCDATVP